MKGSGGGKPPFDARLLDTLGVAIGGIAIDSRKVRPGDLFVAYPGGATDGRRHIPQALHAGAVAVLWECAGFQWDPALKVPNIGVLRLREHLGIASQFWSSVPSSVGPA
jgi:UDP-N-acetylmuramoyl-L-alanyl-D-glutamate--2,6-diaminopimelate ligase